jgi:hypothetical protein
VILDQYSNLFVASAGSAAAFIGLLFVALTIANQSQTSSEIMTRRQSLSASAFALLIDAFVVSIAGLAGDLNAFVAAMFLVATFGLLVTGRHLPRAIRAGNWQRGSFGRTANFVLPMTSIPTYLAQVGLGSWLLADSNNADVLRASVLLILALYAGALGRAWEVTKT